MASSIPILRVRALSKVYRQGIPGFAATHTVLHNVNLDIYANECVAIVGPRGSGKSTLLFCLAGLLHPSTGLIHWHLPRDSQGRSLSILYIPEHPGYYGFLTVHEALEYYADARSTLAYDHDSYVVSGPQRAERIEYALTRMKLSAFRETRIRQLSQPALQRLRLAQALAGTPRVILLDELLTDLDPETYDDIQHVLSDLITAGVIVILASRDATAAARVATRIIPFDQPPQPNPGRTPLPPHIPAYLLSPSTHSRIAEP